VVQAHAGFLFPTERCAQCTLAGVNRQPVNRD